MTIKWNDQYVEKTIINSDWPMSIDYSLCLLTKHKCFNESIHFKGDSSLISDDINDCAGVAFCFQDQRMYGIYISENIELGHNLNKVIQVVTHECSHICDYVFENIGVCDPDTEVRAYLLDWLVAKVLNHVK